MKYAVRILACTFALLVGTAVAHNGEDPKRELEKDMQRLTLAQEEFENLQDDQSRIDNLEKQIGYLQGNALVVRNMLAREYPKVKESMTKFELDYLEILDQNLKNMKRMLKQVEHLVEG
jgi:hypothetical protein